ncbi:MAG: hypothetical protein JWR61_495 [Ferruginibacter sp.]|uniref:glycosyltransferase n=1 Tax=Ferruginibacter sp. TaxID=1940288 RepID=UPI002658D017|nr:glycosyltransferase [Ferruginibacter sp.]MDB5275540.1 hypothetical protein [Ferruginibacter sp.]
MRILLVVFDINNSATGLVIKNVLGSLVLQNPELEIICNKVTNNEIPADIFYEINGGNLDYDRFDKLLLVLTRKNFKGLSWIYKGVQIAKKIVDSFNPELVLVISSAYGFPVFELGYRISRKFNIPLAIHAVDPLPSTAGWGENQQLRKSIISIIKPYYKHATIVSSTNESMLNYQKNVIGEKYIKNSFVLPNPYSPLKNNLTAPLEQKSFVYLGSVYGKRNIQHLIDAFTVFCNRHQDAKLYFVGSIDPGKAVISKHVADKIELINWTDEPEIFIFRCAILVDIDADIQHDVFISSKLTNYLVADRVILSISPPDSPARKLMQHLHNTVVVTADSKAEILNALEEALNKSQNLIDFGERKEIRNYLSPKTVAKNLLDNLNSVLTNGNSF